jgi:hypothetical protein
MVHRSLKRASILLCCRPADASHNRDFKDKGADAIVRSGRARACRIGNKSPSVTSSGEMEAEGACGEEEAASGEDSSKQALRLYSGRGISM